MKAMIVSSSMTSSAEEYEKQTPRTRSISKLFQIALAFSIVFFPLVLVATLLCLFVTLPIWTIQNPPDVNANLPLKPLNDSFFITAILGSKVAFTSSFASNIAQWAATPFLLLFSFLVALELANRHETVDPDQTNLLRSHQQTLFSRTVLRRLWRARNTKRARGTRIAGVGALISIILTILLLVGDKLLQGTIDTTSQRLYYDIDTSPDANFDASFNFGFVVNGTICPPNDTIPDIYGNTTYTVPPCSIDATSPWTLRDAPATYRVLATGLLNQTGGYNEEDFSALSNASQLGIFSDMQLVTHIDLVNLDQHVFLFDPTSAEEDIYSQEKNKLTLLNNDYERFGLDYIANTTSIVTKCSPITVDCGLHNITGDDPSIPYHCSDIFEGDLNKIPDTGLERLKGWNMAFYNLENGSPRRISIASQLNPFTYNVSAVVDSINLGGLIEFGDPQVARGIVVESGDGRVGFALSCTSTVYDVTYSLVDGNIQVFNKTLADPRTAAIIKAPLQAGFGSYTLFEKAAVSMLFSNLTVMDSMDLAFSQTFLALAAGVYARAPMLAQRWRADMTLTKIGKGPFYFLVICMFLYAFVVLVFTVIALSIFRRDDVRGAQAQLIPKE